MKKKIGFWDTLGVLTALVAWRTVSVDLPISTSRTDVKACGLTYVEIQTKLNQIEIDWKAGRLTADQYTKDLAYWMNCRQQVQRAIVG